MKKSLFALVAVLILSALVLSACGSQSSGGTSTRPTPPAAYAGKTNPVKGNADAVAKGKAEYTALCQTCHGATGAGDGPAGAALNPKPGAVSKAVAETSDAYLFWRLADGGAFAPFNSSMPAHKATLSEEKIWQIIAFMQGGFK